jgi:hypothetical protein
MRRGRQVLRLRTVVDQMHKIVKELPDLEDVTRVWAVADGRVAQGDAAFVADLGIALAKTYGTREQMWQYRSVFDHLLRLLTTTSGPENASQALRLVSSAAGTSRELDRYAASLLASGHEATDRLLNGGENPCKSPLVGGCDD